MSEFLHSSFVGAWIFQSGFPWEVWLPYLFGAIILAIGFSGRRQSGIGLGIRRRALTSSARTRRRIET